MRCKAIMLKLAALVDGELSNADAEEARRHLDQCGDCAAAAAQTAAVRRLAAAWTATGLDVWEGVRAEMEAQDTKELVATVRALEAEVRALRAEVAGLKARAEWSDGSASATGPMARTVASTDSRLCLRIV